MLELRERLIQDAISHGKRLEKLLNRELEHPWRFDDSNSEQRDVVNQEYSVGGGRIDVLATFNGRTSLVIIETKAGLAGADELDQLRWYTDRFEKIKEENRPQLGSVAEWIGILLAQDFAGIPVEKYFPKSAGTYLVKFDLTRADGFPFALVESVSAAAPQAPSRAYRRSELVQFSDHLRRVKAEGLGELAKDIANCFLPDGDKKRAWITVNPKGGHVGIHYKGVGAVTLYAGAKSLSVIVYGEAFRVPGEEGKLRTRLSKLIDEIDEETKGIIGSFEFVD